MTHDAYRHVLQYFCGITILSCSAYKQFWPRAKTLLDNFVSEFSNYYGRAHMISNIHNLQHVAEEVEIINAPAVSHFSLQVFVDGLPLHKSGLTQLWPILVKVQELKRAPVQIIGFFSKPENVEDYLRPLVDEMNKLQQHGLKFVDNIVSVSINIIIADSPARAFVKGTTGFNGKHGCTKCTCVGVYLHEEHKVVFESINAAPRTDADFRNRTCKEHHKGIRTPLEDLRNFNMVKNVVVGDRLHLIDLGVTRQIFRGILDHKYNNFMRWSPRQKDAVSKYLTQIKFPSEIH
uniref:Uncharacterized protein n=1 Tax=Anopheles dirus TaxID=7168 RepID=A0A182NVM9_9DIPT